MGLRETLEAATPGPWEVRIAAEVRLRNILKNGWFVAGNMEQQDARLIALAPELAALCLASEKASKKAERAASRAHDAMWAMDFDKTAAGRAEREEWKRLRQQASNEIWKLHEQLRPLLARLDQIGAADETRLGKEQT